jgi:hypothetical protein
MLAQYVVDRVRKLRTEEKLSYRAISKRTGASRGAIAKIANGQRPYRLSGEDEESDDSPVPPERCPTCGGLVFPPCCYCNLEMFLREHPEKMNYWRPEIIFSDVKLDLRPRDRARYEIARRKRREMKAPVVSR